MRINAKEIKKRKSYSIGSFSERRNYHVVRPSTLVFDNPTEYKKKGRKKKNAMKPSKIKMFLSDEIKYRNEKSVI